MGEPSAGNIHQPVILTTVATNIRALLKCIYTLRACVAERVDSKTADSDCWEILAAKVSFSRLCCSSRRMCRQIHGHVGADAFLSVSYVWTRACWGLSRRRKSLSLLPPSPIYLRGLSQLPTILPIFFHRLFHLLRRFIRTKF